MIELFKIIGTITIGTVSIFGIVGYIFKAIFEKFLEGKLQEHKQSLELITIEHQIRFVELHKERAALIKNLYLKINEFKIAIHVFIKYVDKENSEKAREMLDKWGLITAGIAENYENNKIYFGNTTCKLMDTLFVTIKEINEGLMILLRDYTISELIQNKDNKLTEFKRLTDIAKVTIKEKMDPVKAELETDFRLMLGVKN